MISFTSGKLALKGIAILSLISGLALVGSAVQPGSVFADANTSSSTPDATVPVITNDASTTPTSTPPVLSDDTSSSTDNVASTTEDDASSTPPINTPPIKFSAIINNVLPLTDTVPPTVTVTPTSSSILHGTETFTITVSDNEPLDASKNTKIWVYLYDNGGGQKSQGANVDLSSGTGTFTVDATKLDDGAATLDVGRVQDAAGNYSGSGDSYFHGYIVDNTGPVVTVTPQAGSTLSGTVTFNITVTDANPLDPTKNKSIWVYLYDNGGTQKHQGANVDLSGGTGSFTVDTTALDNGAATLDVGRVQDAVGNYSGASDNYFKNYTINNIVDTTRPTLVYNAPATNSYASTSLPVSVTASDSGSGIKNVVVHYYSGNTLLGSCGAGANNLGGVATYTYTCTIDTSKLADGTYSLRSGTFDEAGNNMTVSLPFSIDRTRPTLVYNTPVANSYASTSLPVSITVGDTESGVRNTLVHYYSGSTFLGSCGTGATNLGGVASYTYTCTLNTSKLADGTYSLRSGVYDEVGNNKTVSQPFSVDNTKPTAQITAPANNSTQTGSFTITGTASDAGSGIDHILVYIEHDPWSAGGYVVKAAPAAWDAGTGTFSYDASGIPDGAYDVKVVVYDKAGNVRYALSGNTGLTLTVSNPQPVPSVTTDVAANITSADATLTGTNGPVAADNSSFWVSTSTIDTSSPTIPDGVYSTHTLGPVAAGTDYTVPLSSLVSSAVVHGQTSGTMPVVMPNTTYYYVAWVEVGGTWYPGQVQSFTTSDGPVAPTPSVTTDSATNISASDAVLNGTDGPLDAQHESFWVSTAPFDMSNPNSIPASTASTQVIPAVAANGSFTANLASVTTSGIPSNLSAIQASTTYYYVAWAQIGGAWYHGDQMTVTTATNTLPPPAPVFPTDGATLTSAQLDHVGWTAVSDANTPITYVYEVANASTTNPDGSFTNPVYTQSGLTDNQISTPSTPEGTYYWHVRAVDSAHVTSDWSSVTRFTVQNSISPTNVAPVADDQNLSVTEGNQLDITLTATDTDNDTLTYATTSSPTSGSLSGSGANLVYTPNNTFTGTDSFTFVANDGQEDSNTATVTITVNATNQNNVVTPQFTFTSNRGGISGQFSGGSSAGSNGGGQVLGASTYNFTKDLHYGMHDPDVAQLQQFLITEGYSIPDGVTDYFGPETRAALIAYQKANGISPATGYFGPITRAKVNLGVIPTSEASH